MKKNNNNNNILDRDNLLFDGDEIKAKKENNMSESGDTTKFRN